MERIHGWWTVTVLRWLIVVITLAIPMISLAEEISMPSNPEARGHLSAGTRLYRLREFERAIEEYKAGALKEEAAVFHYNLGQCYRQLGRYEDAIWHYERFLDRAKPLPDTYRGAVEGFIKDMRAELEKQARTRQPTEPVPDVSESSSTQDLSPGLAAVQVGNESWYADTFGWGLAGTGMAASAVSIGLAISAKGLTDDSNSALSQSQQEALREKADDRRLAAAIVGVAGGAALIAGIVKLAIGPEPRDSTTSAGLDVGVSPSGVMVMGRF